MIDDALDGLTRRQMEELRDKLELQLRSCSIDGREGAVSYSLTRKGIRASILLCKPCFERLRLPESRAKGDDDASEG